MLVRYCICIMNSLGIVQVVPTQRPHFLFGEQELHFLCQLCVGKKKYFRLIFVKNRALDTSIIELSKASLLKFISLHTMNEGFLFAARAANIAFTIIFFNLAIAVSKIVCALT